MKKRAMRRSLIKGTDRSDKIRTYNYVQVCALVVLWVDSHIVVIGSCDRSPDRVHDHELAKCHGR